MKAASSAPVEDISELAGAVADSEAGVACPVGEALQQEGGGDTEERSRVEKRRERVRRVKK